MLSCSVDKLTPSIRIKQTLKMNYRWKVEEMILIMMMDLGNSKIIHTTITIINSICSSSMGISEHNRLKSQKLIILSSWLQMSLNSINYCSLRMMKISSVISMKLPKKHKKMIRIRILLVLLLLSLQSRIISVTQMRKSRLSLLLLGKLLMKTMTLMTLKKLLLLLLLLSQKNPNH